MEPVFSGEKPTWLAGDHISLSQKGEVMTNYLQGADLREFLLYLHGYGYDEAWIKNFKEKYPRFKGDALLKFVVEVSCWKLPMKTDDSIPLEHQVIRYMNHTMRLRWGISSLHEEGIMIQPLANCGDLAIGQTVPKLYFPFSERKDFWGDTRSKDFPEHHYPHLRIVGVEL